MKYIDICIGLLKRLSLNGSNDNNVYDVQANGQKSWKIYSMIEKRAKGLAAIPKERSDFNQGRCGLMMIRRV